MHSITPSSPSSSFTFLPPGDGSETRARVVDHEAAGRWQHRCPAPARVVAGECAGAPQDEGSAGGTGGGAGTERTPGASVGPRHPTTAEAVVRCYGQSQGVRGEDGWFWVFGMSCLKWLVVRNDPDKGKICDDTCTLVSQGCEWLLTIANI